MVDSLIRDNQDYIRPISCTVHNNTLFYVDGLSNKVYINRLEK